MYYCVSNFIATDAILLVFFVAVPEDGLPGYGGATVDVPRGPCHNTA